ncbi:hypothetical protein HYW83_05575 [Candidatus Peregrinibacteria bacterium]|nr:hypothetical protein [Candidatus Peregrinibacteria bacterium]
MSPPEKREGRKIHEGRRTDYKRDTEELQREQFLDESRRDRERLKGKIEQPEQKLAKEVRESLETRVPDAVDREKVYRLMSVYEFIPSSQTELGFFLHDLEILEYQPAMLFYEFLSHEFGYKFELTFPRVVKDLINYENLQMKFQMAEIEVSLSGSDEKMREFDEKRNTIMNTVLTRIFVEARRRYGTGFFKNSAQKFRDHYQIPLSASGLLLYFGLFDDKDKKPDTASLLSVDQHAVQEKIGPLFQGNEMLCILYSVHKPKEFEAMVAVAQTLKRHTKYEPLDKYVFEVFGSIENLPDFLAFWNWIEYEFLQNGPLTLRSADDLLEQWNKLKPAKWDKTTANRIRDVWKECGIAATRPEFLTHIADYYWSDEEMEALRSIKKQHSFRWNENLSVNMLHKDIREILKKGLLARIADPQNAPLYRAAANYKYDPQAPLENLHNFLETEKGIAVLEKKDPNARNILQVLGRTNVPLNAVARLASGITQKVLENLGASSPILTIVHRFAEKPDLIHAWEKLCQNYQWDELELGHLEYWLDLPDEKQKQLVNSEHIARVRMLRQTYHFKISPPILITFMNDFESDENFRKQISVLSSKPCQGFFKKYGTLFAESNLMDETWQQDRLLDIVKFFQKQKTDKRFLRWAKRWKDAGQGVDSVFMGDESQSSLAVLDRPEFPRLVAVCKILKIEMGSISNLARLVNHVATLEKKEFSGFLDTMERIYGVTHEFYMLDDLAKIFEDTQARAFFTNPDVQNFYRKLQTYGYSFEERNYMPFEERYKKLRGLYETKGLFEAIERLGKAYGMDVQKLAGEAEEEENGGGVFGRISNMMMPGIETRGFDFMSELKVLVEQGDFELLVAPETVEFVKFCEKTYGYQFSLLNMSSLMTVVKSPRLKAAVRDPRLPEVIKRLGKRIELRFSFNALDLFVDIMDHEKEFEETMDLLEQQYAYRLKDPGDLFFIVDLLGKEAVIEKLKSKTFQEMIGALKKEQKYKFEVTDMYALIYLDDHRGLTESIYDSKMEDFAERIFGKRFGNNLAARIKFFEVYKDETKRRKLDSENFRSTQEQLRREIGTTAGADDADGLLLCMNHPEVFSFLKAVNFRIRLFDYQAVNFFDAMPSLITMARLHAEKYIDVLKKTAKGWWYDFNPLDGAAWEKIIDKYPSFYGFSVDAQALQKRIGERSISANDLYIGLLLGERLSFDRSALEQELKEPFKDDIHRVDSNFDSYRSYNDLSKFSVMQLNKMRLIRQWLALEKARKEVGTFIRRDVQQYPYTELGSVIVIKPNGDIENHEYPPKLHFQNGSYAAPAEAKNEHAVSLAISHLHALKFNQGNHAGPSGSRFSIGGDISVARIEERDSVVMTSLSENQFAVHFYTASGDVAFLGRFEYK